MMPPPDPDITGGAVVWGVIAILALVVAVTAGPGYALALVAAAILLLAVAR